MVALLLGECGLWKVWWFYFLAYSWFQLFFPKLVIINFVPFYHTSYILSMALVDNHLTVETIVHLYRLELEFQVVHYFFLKIDLTVSALCMLHAAWAMETLFNYWAEIRKEVWELEQELKRRVGMSTYSGLCFCSSPGLLCKVLGGVVLVKHWSPYPFWKQRRLDNDVIFLIGFLSSKSKMTGDCCVFEIPPA